MRVILAGATVVVLVAAIFLVRPNAVAAVDEKVCDLLTASVSRGNPSGRVAIVEIDEASLEALGRWPWPRDLLGRLVGRILDRGASAVVLDMLLREEDVKNDRSLAAGIAGRPVVIGYAFQFEGGVPAASGCAVAALPLTVVGPNQSWQNGFFHASGMLCSVPGIAAAAAGNGFLNAAPDSDGKLRRIPLVVEHRDQHYASLALAAVNVYRRASAAQLDLNGREASRLSLGTNVVPLEGPSTMRLRFRGPRRTFPYVTAAGVMSGAAPADGFEGKIAIVGGSALGLPTAAATPVDPMLPDAEIQATAIDNVLQNDAFHRPASLRLWETVLALVVGVVGTMAPLRIRTWWGNLIAPSIAVGIGAACVLLLSRAGLVLSPLPVVAAVACVAPVVMLLNSAEAVKRGRAVVREGELRYERLVENVNDAIIMTDEEGRLVFANRRFREWFGLEGKDIRRVAPEDFIAPEWRNALRDQHQRWMRGEKPPAGYEYEGLKPDGTRIWIEALATAIEEDGRITGAQAALRDVTERKRIEAQYLQAQKMESIGRLAGIVAHDFNNLLTVINGYCDLLLKSWPETNEYSSSVEEIRAAGERAADLTRNLLAFSRKQRVQPKTLDLNSIVAESEKMFRRLLGEDIQLTTRLSPGLGNIRADAGQVHQVLMNLLVNARDAMPRGGTVVLETKNDAGGSVHLGVTDNGTGMTDEVKRHLFEPFYTTKEAGKGTGLGLATVFGIVEQSAGKIEVSSAVGKGTTVHIYWPRAEAEPAAESGANGRADSVQGSATVLVVEDQDAVRRYIRAVLEDSGYRVMEAGNGPDALALADRFSDTIHLLLTDLIMPMMNGRDLAERLLAARPALKVLFMSGYEEETIGSHGIMAADLAFLAKPFRPEELMAKVRETLVESAKPRSRPQSA